MLARKVFTMSNDKKINDDNSMQEDSNCFEEVSDDNFEERVIKESHKRDVVVDFWAGWCMPCKMLDPILEKVSQNQGENRLFVKINADKNPRVSMEYDVLSIPSVKIFHKGKVLRGFTGFRPRDELIKWLEKK